MPFEHLIYVSSGNVPSKAANSMAQLKMAQAFAEILPRFELVVPTDWLAVLGLKRFDLCYWYGLAEPLPLIRLPIYPWLRYPLPANVRLRFFMRLAAIVTRFKHPQVAYTRSLPAARLLTAYRVPTVYECHDPATAAFTTAFSQRPRFREYLHGVVTTRPSLAESYVSLGIPGVRVLVVPGAVDLRLFTRCPERDMARRALKVGLDVPLALYAGHLYANRGIEDIFAVAQRNPAVQFMLVGGWSSDVARREAERRDKGLNNVRLCGFVPQSELLHYLAAADVCLMPFSRHLPNADWAIPTKMYEYMAAARPIIATNLPLAEGVLRHEENALLVEPDTPAAIHTALQRLLNNPALAKRLAAQAQQDVQPFSWENRARRILNWLQNTLSV